MPILLINAQEMRFILALVIHPRNVSSAGAVTAMALGMTAVLSAP